MDTRGIEHWRDRAALPSNRGGERLTKLWNLQDHLFDTFTSVHAVRTWVHSPIRYLSGAAPAALIRAGNVDRVETALEALDSGVFI